MSLGIPAGNEFGVYIVSASITPAATATITCAEQTFTVTGAKVGDFVMVNPPSITAGVSLTCARVSAANTVALTFCNPTAGSLTAPAGTYVFKFSRPESNVAKTAFVD